MLIILALLIGFTGFSIYYQSNYLKLSKDYKQKVTELKDLGNTLTTERSKLNQTSFQLQIKEEREQDIGTKYTILKSQKDQLESDKSKLQVDVAQKNQKILELSGEIDQINVQLINIQNQLNQAKNDINDLNSQLRSWKTKAQCWQDRAALADADESNKVCS